MDANIEEFKIFLDFINSKKLFFSKGFERSPYNLSLSLVFNETSYRDRNNLKFKNNLKVKNDEIFDYCVDFLKKYENYFDCEIHTEEIDYNNRLDIKEEFLEKSLKIINIQKEINGLKKEIISLGAIYENDEDNYYGGTISKKNIFEDEFAVPYDWYNYKLKKLLCPYIIIKFKDNYLDYYEIANSKSFNPRWE